MRRITHMISIAALIAAAAVAGLDLPSTAQGGNNPQSQAAAAERTVTFAVQNMTCAACPITVRTAMRNVEGVKSVTVDLQAQTATVVFDPAVATIEQIGAASTNAGYPAAPAS